jgi:predicted nuclease of predicted toxin-antitoxin system
VKILIDMNLSPVWVLHLRQAGFECVHWSEIGHPGAPDSQLMDWARANGHVLFTHDLDFGALLAATRAKGPSVLQVRVKDPMPDVIGHDVVRVLLLRREALEQGSLVTIDKARARVRVLPLVTEQPPD